MSTPQSQDQLQELRRALSRAAGALAADPRILSEKSLGYVDGLNGERINALVAGAHIGHGVVFVATQALDDAGRAENRHLSIWHPDGVQSITVQTWGRYSCTPPGPLAVARIVGFLDAWREACGASDGAVRGRVADAGLPVVPSPAAPPMPLVEIGARLRDLYAAIEEALTKDQEPPGYKRLKEILGRGSLAATTWADPTIASGLGELEAFGLLMRRGRGTRHRIVALHPIESARVPPRDAQPAAEQSGPEAQRKYSGSDAAAARGVNSARAHTSDHDPRGRRKTGRPAS